MKAQALRSIAFLIPVEIKAYLVKTKQNKKHALQKITIKNKHAFDGWQIVKSSQVPARSSHMKKCYAHSTTHPPPILLSARLSSDLVRGVLGRLSKEERTSWLSRANRHGEADTQM